MRSFEYKSSVNNPEIIDTGRFVHTLAVPEGDAAYAYEHGDVNQDSRFIMNMYPENLHDDITSLVDPSEQTE